MKISKTLLIVLGIVALCLFLTLLAILIAYLIQRFKNSRSKFKYRRLAKKYDRHKRNYGKMVMPKFSTTFPTQSVPLQLDHGIHLTESSDSEDIWQKTRNVNVPSRRDKFVLDRRARWQRRVLSDSDIRMISQQDADLNQKAENGKNRSQSESKEMKRRMRRSRSRSALRALAEISGQIEYTIYYDSVKRKLEFKIIQVLDINEITPDLFHDRCEVVDIKDVTLDIEKPCLIREKNGSIAFSNLSELGVCVQLTMFPYKRHIGTTDYKHDMNSLIFNERFVIEHCNIACYYGCSLRFQVLLRYGQHKQIPLIIGETLVSLRDVTSDVIVPFTDYLKLPVDEDELEIASTEQVYLGKLVVSVRYELLRQQLSIRIVSAKDLPKMGIHGQPNTSVKVNVYLDEVRQLKKVTEIVKKSTRPTFNHTFHLDVAQSNLDGIGVLLEMRVHGAVYNTVLGYVHIGPAAVGPGADHWEEVLSFSDYNAECEFDIMDKKPRKICLNK